MHNYDGSTTQKPAPATNGRHNRIDPAQSTTSQSPTQPNPPQRGDGEPAPLTVEPYFCPTEGDVFDTVEWERRTADIKDENGGVLFEQRDCEIPKPWTALATNVVVSKYFYGEPDTDERETSVRQVVHRVARTIADWGIDDGYFASAEDGENFYRELAWLCLHQHGAFNSPVWFNVGLYHQYGVEGSQGNYRYNPETHAIERPDTPYEFPQASACFIQSVDDNMEDIMRLATSEAMLFKFGSGTGTDLSTLRSQREKLSGGGVPSGPLSFMRVYDQIAAVVKSGGKTRRAAKMQSLKDWHPDILEFIQAKAREEKKARTLINSGEYEANFNGEAYSSIMFQNANLSVRTSDEFMQAVLEDRPWKTRYVTDPNHAGPEYPARTLLREMAEGTWYCGDPGVQYETTINRWHTCPNSGPINASNPCSEYMFLDDTACNLASINLKKMQREDGSFDVDRFRRACAIYLTAQEILVDHASYPTPSIAENSHIYRPLGLGYANLGSLLMSMGIPYDSDAGRGICGAITALLNGQGYLTSSRIASYLGPFKGYAENDEAMLRVMRMHQASVENIDPACPEDLCEAASEVWRQCVASGEKHGYRNAQSTVLAPTGTIAFMMDCDTTGIEPDIALVKYKQLAGGGMMKIVNRTVPRALEVLGYDQPEIEGVLDYIEKHDTIEGAPALKDEHLPVFDCAFKPANGTRTIPWKAHVTMMAAAQPFLSGAISKTVNMPEHSTVEDVEHAYMEGWRLGLKALAIYRDGSKQSQPLATKTEGDKAKATQSEAQATRDAQATRANQPSRDRKGAPPPETIESARHLVRRRLPDTRQSVTHKFSIEGHEGYITVGLFDDGEPGELFITMAKEGSTIGGLMDAIGTQTSLCLQYGVPLEALTDKFSHMRFEPSGWTSNPAIPIAKSIVDYIFRWLAIQFIPNYQATKDVAETGEQRAESQASGPASPPRFDATASVDGQESNLQNEENAAAPHHATHRAPNTEHPAPSTQHSPPESQTDPEPNTASTATLASRDAQFAHFQADAPACDACGAITVRNGNCYLCHNCGNSMGCS